ncbi:MAG: TRAP transporter substrate-binding protein DctP [Thermodesulfobacteriota bacterium]
MKKLTNGFTVFLVAVLAIGFYMTSPDQAYAKKLKTIKFIAVGAGEGQETSAETMALNPILGALDYRLRTYGPLKGKYELKWVDTLFPTADEGLSGVASGAGEMILTGPHYMEALEPAFKLVEAPGIFESWDHFRKTMNTPAWKAVHERMAKEKGITILQWVCNIGDYYLYTTKGPVVTPDDVKGQKIRYPGGEGFSKALKEMGTTPISLPYTEVVTALQTNMIDGLLTDMFGAIYFYELPRYTKYCVKAAWAIQPICFAVNTQWWESLPDGDRKAMQDVFDRIDVSQFFEKATQAIADDWAANPKTELITVSDAELNLWQKGMKAGAAKLLKDADPKLVEAIEASR